MSVEREDGYIVFQCDQCADALPTEETDFTAAWDIAFGSGWRIVSPLFDSRIHLCPDCSQPAEPFA